MRNRRYIAMYPEDNTIDESREGAELLSTTLVGDVLQSDNDNLLSRRAPKTADDDPKVEDDGVDDIPPASPRQEEGATARRSTRAPQSPTPVDDPQRSHSERPRRSDGALSQASSTRSTRQVAASKKGKHRAEVAAMQRSEYLSSRLPSFAHVAF